MLYREIAGRFGGVEGELHLKEGLNLFYAPNESGKSTWCALIRAVLYGVDSSERAKAGTVPVKTKYQPWSGRPAFGRMVVAADGRDITLTRQSERGRMFQAFSAVYTDTGSPVRGMDGTNAGETLTGVAAPVFVRSLFCTGEQLAVTEDAELERKIAAVAGTGDDEISAGLALEQLGAWKRERRYNGRGSIPQTEERIRKNEAELREIEELNRDLLQFSAAVREAEQETAALRADAAIFARRPAAPDAAKAAEAEAAAEQAAAAAEAFCRAHDLTGARADSETCMRAAEQFRLAAGREAECRIAEAEAYQARAAANACVCPAELSIFEGCTADFARETAAADCARSESLLKARAKFGLFPVAVLTIAAGILLSLPNYEESLLGTVLMLLLTVAGLAIGGLGVASVVRSRKHREAGQALCDSYGVQRPMDMLAMAGAYEQYLAECRRLADAADAANAKLASLREAGVLVKNGADQYAARLRIQPDSEAAEELVRLNRQYAQLCANADRAAAACTAVREAAVVQPPEEPTRFPTSEETEAALAEAEERLLREERAMAACEGRLSRCRDLAFLSAETEQLRTTLQTLQEEYAAIELAQTWLTESADELSSRLTPKLCRRAGELFAAMTGGKYGDLTIDQHLVAAVREAGSVEPHGMRLLSRGALDQLYLAMRIALSELCCPDGLPPLVLDDCLAAFDDERADQTMALLAELAKTRQILFLTCRKREADAAMRYGATEIRAITAAAQDEQTTEFQ